MKANSALRKRLRADGITLWQIALKIGVAESTIVRWLRVELDREKQQLVEEAICEILKEERGI